jgi:phenylacetate-CoA ligase
MEQIARYMRNRRKHGLRATPSNRAWRPQRWAVGNPERVRALQARQLRKTVEYVYRYVPFYRQAMDALGIGPADIRSQDDVHKLPVTQREQVSENAEAFISRYPGLVPTLPVYTGGTTGKSLEVYLTTEELRYYAAARAISYLRSGMLGPQGILQLHQSLDNSMEGLITSMGARLAGALVLSIGDKGTLDDHVESILKERHIPGKRAKVSGLVTPPSHLWALTQRAEEMGVDFQASGLRWIVTGGATVSDDLRQRVSETWGARLIEVYGLREMVTGSATQCPRSERLHFSDPGAYAEVLDPETEAPLPAGQPGVLAVTTFYPYRELMPFLRYRTEDLVILSPDPICTCGTATTQILDIVGRADHVILVGENTFYAQAIGDSLLAFRQLVLPPRFTLRTEQRKDAQYVILDVEVGNTLSPQEDHQLRQRIKEGIVFSRHWEVRCGSVKLEVNLCPAGSIETPFPYKHQWLVLDRRGE